MELNRRDFLKGAGAAAVGAATLGALQACSPSQTSTTGTAEAAGTNLEKLHDESRIVTEEITDADISETHEYDLVVIGAGTAGVTAATIAAERGVGKVAVLQAEDRVISQGNMGSGLIVEESDDLALQRFKQDWNELYCHNPDQHLIDNYLKYSGAAAEFVAEKAALGGLDPQYIEISDDIVDYGDEGKVVSRRVLFSPKPVTYADGMGAIATLGPDMGIDYYYNTPGVKLIKDESEKVIAAIGHNSSDGYIRFNASKGVILTTGCFANNQAMLETYCPDALGFMPKVSGRFGDGHLLALDAGGHLRGGSYAKMIHDNDAGPMQDIPWLAVTDEGERFMNEEVDSIFWNNVAKNLPNKRFTSIYDSNFGDMIQKLGGRPVSAEDIEAFIPGTEAAQAKGVYADFVATYKADTLEELAEHIGIPASALVATVDRYNELVASGNDSDFGKKSEYLAPIDTPPYYGSHRWPRLSTILSGVDVNENMQVVDAEGQVVEGLYAAGNCGGRPGSGAGDWLQVALGESLGFAFTGGYVAGMHAAGALD